MTENDRDVELLRADPRRLILKHQEIVKIVVKKFIEAGMFEAQEYDDIVQEIFAALLAKIPAMQSQYNGKSLFKTYFSVIVRNICLKYHRQGRKEIDVVREDPEATVGHNPIENKELIEHEVHRFKAILGLYHKQQAKLLLCLKLHFKIPITPEDIQLWYPQIREEDRRLLLSRFGSEFERLTDLEIYEIVTPVVNRIERKKNSVDALRKWTDSKIHEILGLLNGSPRHANYTPETLKILTDDFFSPFLVEK